MRILSILFALCVLPFQMISWDKYNRDRKKYYSPDKPVKKLLRHSEAMIDRHGETVIVDEPLTSKICLN